MYLCLTTNKMPQTSSEGVVSVRKFCGYHFKCDMSQTLLVFFSSLTSLFLFTDSSLLMKTANPFSLTAPWGKALFFGSQSGTEHCRCSKNLRHFSCLLKFHEVVVGSIGLHVFWSRHVNFSNLSKNEQWQYNISLSISMASLTRQSMKEPEIAI